MRKVLLPVRPIAQNPAECGPACVKSILDAMLPRSVSLSQLEREISPAGANKGREWDFRIALAALKRGVPATVLTHETLLFDPAWFRLDRGLLIGKLDASAKALTNELESLAKARKSAVNADVDWFTLDRINGVKEAANFLRNGGSIEFLHPKARFSGVSPRLLKHQLRLGRPVIVPIDTSRFYGRPRRDSLMSTTHNDLTGWPWGHIIAVRGFDRTRFHVADPGHGTTYPVSQEHLVGSIRYPQVIAIGTAKRRRRAR
ncbi:hypothetical protein HYS54_02910 [Candidatus Micrarchaeota archaeon]|nr:hypothetical protein [Candidatus Micrarchaeota archaeon]